MKLKFVFLVTLFLISFSPLTLSAKGAAKTPNTMQGTFQCKGFAMEAGERRELQLNAAYQPGPDSSSLAELSFHFWMSESQRLTLQMRALTSRQGLQVGATFIEIATEPLGKVETVFSEKIYPTEASGEYLLEKYFPALKIALVCKNSL